MSDVVRTGRSLGVATYLGYASGSLATGAFSTVPGLLLLYYLTDTLGVPAGLAGVTVLVPKFWDVFWNPVVGGWSDRTNTRWGGRRPWMLAGALLLPALFVAMFAAPAALTAAGAAAWTGLAFLGSAAAYALFQVPYVSMPAEMTEDYHERTTIIAYRIVALTLGILMAGAVAPLLVAEGGGGRSGYLLMAVAVAAFLLAGMLGAVLGTGRAPTATKPGGAGSLLAALRVARGNPWFLPLWGCFVVQALASAATLASIPYFATYILDRPGATTPLFACLVAPAILVMPLWTWFGRRAGKKRAYVVASLCYAAASAGLLAGGVLPFAGALALVVAAGVGYSGMQVFPLAMLPDTIAADEARSGVRRAGLLTGIWTAGETGAFALGPSLVGAVLGAAGFVSTEAGTRVVQSPAAQTGILLSFSVLPAAAMLLSLLLLRRYNLSEARLAAVVGGREEARP
ncbi:MAG: MFS transporter [Deltaproteobacteria bacterium]|nr:MFS transporter [Deltaproteobacteria bacterium]